MDHLVRIAIRYQVVEVLNWDRTSFLKGGVQGNIHVLQLLFLAYDAPPPKKKKQKEEKKIGEPISDQR